MKPCGTRSAYTRHLSRGEPIDDACREANRAYAADYRRRKLNGELKPSRSPTRQIIVDHLETLGRPVSSQVLADLVADRHPHLSWTTVQRVLLRMHDEGLVEPRQVVEEWKWEWRLTDAAEGWFDIEEAS